MVSLFTVLSAYAHFTAPSLSIHGDLDRIIPLDLGRRLHDAMGGPKTWYEVEGAGHNDVSIVGGIEYVERVHAFLEGVADGTN